MRNQPMSWADRKLEALLKTLSTAEKPYYFETSCVASTAELIEAMNEASEGSSYEEMAENCDLPAFERVMGYGEDLELKNDWHVSYSKSVYDGKPCYYLDHSRIEYIWVLRG